MTTKRVAVSQNSFRISAPGVPVDTATGTGLVFDAFGDHYNGLYLSGVATSSVTSWTQSTGTNYTPDGYSYTTKRYSTEILFGQTFASVPQVLYAVRPHGTTTPPAPRYTWSHIDIANHKWKTLVVGAATKTDRLILFMDMTTYPLFGADGIEPSYSYDIGYAVFYY